MGCHQSKANAPAVAGKGAVPAATLLEQKPAEGLAEVAKAAEPVTPQAAGVTSGLAIESTPEPVEAKAKVEEGAQPAAKAATREEAKEEAKAEAKEEEKVEEKKETEKTEEKKEEKPDEAKEEVKETLTGTLEERVEELLAPAELRESAAASQEAVEKAAEQLQEAAVAPEDMVTASGVVVPKSWWCCA